MRYLKRFNEANNWTDENISELKEFCEWNLATLLDNGYEFKVDNLMNSIKITINFYTSENKWKTFHWDDISDYFIPFYQVLKDTYKIVVFNDRKDSKVDTVLFSSRDDSWVSENDIIEDNVKIDEPIKYINIYIDGDYLKK